MKMRAAVLESFGRPLEVQEVDLAPPRQGGSFGGARGRTHVPQLVDLYLQGKIDLDGFVSHRLTLDEVNRGFELMEAQDGIRSVINF
jgi:Zn-dependent alcohol dehydrogenase